MNAMALERERQYLLIERLGIRCENRIATPEEVRDVEAEVAEIMKRMARPEINPCAPLLAVRKDNPN